MDTYFRPRKRSDIEHAAKQGPIKVAFNSCGCHPQVFWFRCEIHHSETSTLPTDNQAKIKRFYLRWTLSKLSCRSILLHQVHIHSKCSNVQCKFREPSKKVQSSNLQNLKSYVDDELQKQRDQTESYATQRSGHSYSKQKLYSRSTTTSFASGYYIDKNLKGEFTADKKVRIWLEKSKLQSKANKVDILNAWTRQI